MVIFQLLTLPPTVQSDQCGGGGLKWDALHPHRMWTRHCFLKRCNQNKPHNVCAPPPHPSPNVASCRFLSTRLVYILLPKNIAVLPCSNFSSELLILYWLLWYRQRLAPVPCPGPHTSCIKRVWANHFAMVLEIIEFNYLNSLKKNVQLMTFLYFLLLYSGSTATWHWN